MAAMIDTLRAQLEKTGEITFRVKVRPGAPANRFRGPLGEDTFKLDIAAAPEDGKANDELVRFLSSEFDVPKSHIDIVYGDTARLKIIRVTGGTAGESL